MTLKAQPKASHFIDGDYVEDDKGTLIESIYPATGEVIARLYAATPAIVERAIASAKRAQKEWGGDEPRRARGRILRRAADIIRERNREFPNLKRSTPASLFRKPSLLIRPPVLIASNSSAASRRLR